jgi:hypothetical protein
MNRIHDFLYGWGRVVPLRPHRTVFYRQHPSLYWFKGYLQLSPIWVLLLSWVDDLRGLWRRLTWRPIKVNFSKITTPEFRRDTSCLRDYQMDLRQVILDNPLRDDDTPPAAQGDPPLR